MLYFGSCRYSHGGEYEWNPFISRLHTTREIYQAIDMFDGDYNTWLDKFSQDDANTIWLLCDMGHPGAGWGWEGSGLSLEPARDPKDVKDIMIEVSSKKVCQLEYQGELRWVSKYYLQHYSKLMSIDRSEALHVSLTLEDITEDLKRIKDLIKVKFHPEARLHVIPHLNLKTTAGGDYLPARAELSRWLEAACEKHDINFFNVGEHLEGDYRKPYLDICMPDSTHYATGGGNVMTFITNGLKQIRA